MFTNCIGTHNNLEYLKLAINSIKENSYYDVPLYIYAEGCTDGSNEWLKSKDQNENFRYWIKPEAWKREYHGIGGSMNFLAKKVKTPYINFLHSDMYMSERWDEPLINTIEKYGRKNVVSSYRVEPKIFPHGQETKNGTVVVPKDTFGEFHNNFDAEKFNEWAKKFTQDNSSVDIPMAQGVSFMIHKRDWEDVGGNDPRFAPASHEDVDLFIRMRQKDFHFHTLGESLVYHFGARGSHFPNDDLSESSKRQRESEAKNHKLFRDKWGEGFTTDKYGFFQLRSRL